jgi:putative hydrolase of the HAD superfamily
LRAILFDWGNTLVRSELDPELLAEGHARGLEAVGGDAPSRYRAFADRYAEVVLPPLLEQREAELDYAALVAGALTDVGLDVDVDALDRFLAAEHANWRKAHPVEPDLVELLDAIRERGLRIGLVSNLFDPPELLRRTFAELGVLDRIDSVSVSSEVGWRKPSPRLFGHALAELGVPAGEAAHVGDRRREDVGGAAAVGLRTIQSCWYAVDDAPGPVPTARAETPGDVVRIVDGWTTTGGRSPRSL